MKRTIVLLLVVLLFVVGFGKIDIMAEEPEYTITAGHLFSPADPIHHGYLRFADLVEKYSDGNIVVEVHPAATIGGEAEVFELMQAGAVEMGAADSISFSGHASYAETLYMPFVFDDFATAEAVFDSEIAERVFEKFREDTGIRVLTSFHMGLRSVLSKDPIRSLEDLQGYRLRMPEADLYMETFKQLGAAPTAVIWGELYGALQTGIVDGMEGTSYGIYHAGLYEIADYYNLTLHRYEPFNVAISDEFFKELPVNYQEIIIRSAKEAAEFQRNLAREEHYEYLEILEEEGIEIIEIDREEFIDKIYDWRYDHAERLGGLDIFEDVLTFIENLE